MNALQREALARRILERSPAEQTEVAVNAGDHCLTRFARGISNQNVASRDLTVSVRAIVQNRTGVAVGNEVHDEALGALLERDVAMAKLAPPDPLVPSLPVDARTHAPPGSFDERTVLADPSERAALCARAFERSEAEGFWCAGYASTSTHGFTIANSSGALASFDGTNATMNVKVSAPDSSGYAEQLSTAIGDIDGDAVASRAVEKARSGASPQTVDPGAWTVILEPAAAGELLAYLISHFSAQNYSDGSSFFTGRIGETFFDKRLSIEDDYAHRLAPSMPFDYEGQPKMRLPLVEAGVVRNIVTDSYYAKKLDRPNTGHALAAPNAFGPQALNVVVVPGARSREALIASTKRGLLVSRFWYIRTVDQKRAIVTGMTRDGTFLIENGRISGGVRNLRFNQSIVDALSSAEPSSGPQRTGQYSYSFVVPAIKLDAFTFRSPTEF